MNKRNRVMEIFYRFMSGEHMAVKDLAAEYEVSEKSIQRDISEIKNFMAEYGYSVGKEEVKFDRSSQKELVKRELYHYKPVATLCNDLIDNLYALAEAIDDKQEITITYYKMDKSRIDRRIRPLAIVFSEYYFYLIAVHEVDDEWKERYYRIDRITDMIKHRTRFEVEYDSRFDEGKLKNEIQYMWPGKEQQIEFEFTGPSVQAILDRIPKSRVIKREKNKVTIQATVVHGTGIKMTLLSQGSWVKVLSPQSLVEEMKEEVEKMMEGYR